MDANDEPVSNIVSLEYKKKKAQELSRKEYLDPNVRIRDVEIEVMKLQDHILELEETIRGQARNLSKILRILQSSLGTSASSSLSETGDGKQQHPHQTDRRRNRR